MLDPAALHGLAGEIVCTIAPETEGEPAGMLLSILAASGVAVGPGPHAIADGTLHPPTLFAVTVATGRARKGSGREEETG